MLRLPIQSWQMHDHSVISELVHALADYRDSYGSGKLGEFAFVVVVGNEEELSLADYVSDLIFHQGHDGAIAVLEAPITARF